jgi:hypothetical protein
LRALKQTLRQQINNDRLDPYCEALLLHTLCYDILSYDILSYDILSPTALFFSVLIHSRWIHALQHTLEGRTSTTPPAQWPANSHSATCGCRA